MRVGLLPRQRDCRADAVALGAWERWHAAGVTERASLSNEERILGTNASRLGITDLKLSYADGGTGGPAQAAGPPVRGPLAITSVLLSPFQRLRLVSGSYQPKLTATAALESLAETLQFALARIAAIQIRELHGAGGCQRKSKCVFAHRTSAFIRYACFPFSATKNAAFIACSANAGEESCGAALQFSEPLS